MEWTGHDCIVLRHWYITHNNNNCTLTITELCKKINLPFYHYLEILLNTEVHQVASSWNDRKQSLRVTGYTKLDRIHVTSYRCAKVLHIPFCFQDTIGRSHRSSHPNCLSHSPMRVTLLEFSHNVWCEKTRIVALSRGENKSDEHFTGLFFTFCTVHECDRQNT